MRGRGGEGLGKGARTGKQHEHVSEPAHPSHAHPGATRKNAAIGPSVRAATPERFDEQFAFSTGGRRTRAIGGCTASKLWKLKEDPVPHLAPRLVGEELEEGEAGQRHHAGRENERDEVFHVPHAPEVGRPIGVASDRRSKRPRPRARPPVRTRRTRDVAGGTRRLSPHPGVTRRQCFSMLPDTERYISPVNAPPSTWIVVPVM